MAKYKLVEGGVVVSGTGAYIPNDPANADWQEYLIWTETYTADAADFIDPWNDVRVRRNSLLAECDWTQLSDCPLASGTLTAWVVYRDTLRDIPQDYGNIEDIVWPTKPE